MNIKEPILTTQDALLRSFQETQGKSELNEVIKELFDVKKIFMTTDLTRDEVKLLTRIYMGAEIKDISIWKRGILFYAQLLLSTKRKSRKEILEAVKGYQAEKSLMQKLNPFHR